MNDALDLDWDDLDDDDEYLPPEKALKTAHDTGDDTIAKRTRANCALPLPTMSALTGDLGDEEGIIL